MTESESEQKAEILHLRGIIAKQELELKQALNAADNWKTRYRTLSEHRRGR